MKELQFKTTSKWNYKGDSEDLTELTLIANANGWQKDIIFNQKDFTSEIWEILWKFTEEERKDWQFLINVESSLLKSFFQTYLAKEILTIEDNKGELVYRRPKLTPKKEEKEVETLEVEK